MEPDLMSGGFRLENPALELELILEVCLHPEFPTGKTSKQLGLIKGMLLNSYELIFSEKSRPPSLRNKLLSRCYHHQQRLCKGLKSWAGWPAAMVNALLPGTIKNQMHLSACFNFQHICCSRGRQHTTNFDRLFNDFVTTCSH